jgi:hypothetical protein
VSPSRSIQFDNATVRAFGIATMLNLIDLVSFVSERSGGGSEQPVC